ncbi:MAG: hypothetical protein ACHQEB_03975 [Chitinophagales bacterium]
MKKIACFLVCLALPFSLLAQKKATSETRSTLLAIDIPADAKGDKRFLSKVGIEILINIKIQPLQLAVKSSEYLFWKGDNIKETRGAGIIDSLIKSLKADNWTMAFDEKDDTVIWLLKENKPFILMYITDKNQINLYLGELDKAPAVTFQ